MRKNIINITLSIACLVIILLMLSGCDKSEDNRLEYLAVQLSEGGRWSIIDKNGKMVAKDEYPADATISYIYDGVYWVKTGDKYQLYNVDNPKKPVTKEKFESVTTFFQTDRAAVSTQLGQPIRIINTKGKTIATLPQNVKSCYGFTRDGYAVFLNEDFHMGLINRDGKIAVPATFVNLVGVNEGVSLALKDYSDNKYLIIDTEGKQVGEFLSDRYSPVNGEFHDGKLIVRDANENYPRYHMLNKKGEEVFTFDASIAEIETTAHFQNGYIVFIGSNGMSGIMNDKGKIVVEAKYTALINYGKCLFAAMKEGYWGIINAKDEVIIPFNYNSCIQTAMGDNFILIDGDTYVMLSRDGKEHLSFQNVQAIISPFAENPKDESYSLDFPEDDIINDYGQIGLLGALPKGTTVYTGDMGGYPIEFTITKKPETGELSALYKNVNYGTTMKMVGESLPAQGGEISFFGEENGRQWSFDLDGDADNITGTASGSNNYQFNVKLKRK